MKLTKRILTVLKNFSTINQSIRVTQGSTLRTMSPSKTILASADIDSEFNTEFCIYDLPRFLGAISLYENPSLDITPLRVVIKSETSQVKYICADPEMIVQIPEVKFPEADIKFTLTNENFKSMMKAIRVLSLDAVAIVGDTGTLYIMGTDPDGKIKDTYLLEVGKTNNEFKVIIKLDNLKLIPADYSVSIGQKKGKGIARFSGIDFPATYFVAVDSKSEFITNESDERRVDEQHIEALHAIDER